MFTEGRGRRILLPLLIIALLAAAYYQRAIYNLDRIDYRNANFVFFWLAGRMVVDGENPYDSAAWIAAHDSHDVTWRPNQIFPYPLPLALLLAPLGLTSLGNAYFMWQLLSEALIAGCIWILLGRLDVPDYRRLLYWLVLGLLLLFFGPVFITLQIGALGAFTLAAVLCSMIALEDGHPLTAGLVGSLVLLKPPQGIPLLLLLGIWLIARANWKAIAGFAAGTLLLLGMGVLLDPLWLPKFATAGQAVIDRTLGIQSNMFGVAFLGCGRDIGCMWWLGGAASAIILGAAALYLWRNASALKPWDVFGLAIPVAFTATLYLWSYDQILYIVPIVWVLINLIGRTQSSLPALGYLIVLVLVSFTGMLVQAYTRSDLMGLVTTIVVLGPVLALLPSRRAPAAALGRQKIGTDS